MSTIRQTADRPALLGRGLAARLATLVAAARARLVRRTIAEDRETQRRRYDVRVDIERDRAEALRRMMLTRAF